MKQLATIFSAILVGLSFHPTSFADSKDVNVINTPNVRDADNPARNAFQVTLCTIGWPPGCLPSTPGNFDVPGDKHLVIEYVSANCLSEGAGEVMAELSVITNVNRNGTSHSFIPVQSLVNDHVFVVSQQTRLYADPGTIVGASASSQHGSVGCLVKLSGYFVAL